MSTDHLHRNLSMRQLKLTVFSLSALALHCAPAHAQGCPAGTYPMSGNGVFTCLPDPNYNQQQQSPQSATPTPVRAWESHWGAIATDEPHGVVGSSSGVRSAEKAERKAIEDCKSKGGSNCKLQLSYSNGCGALLVGDKTFNLNWGGSEKEAIQKAMTVCTASDTGCHVYFTSCSQAARLSGIS
ncbi:DUF4189 domain-containing protein [Dyella subtropica]|uniref:DUF4189 domain-containing protein n=1 Tax=Dyella subtropica TaxID=2992127 RepID=UPI003CE55FF4